MDDDRTSLDRRSFLTRGAAVLGSGLLAGCGLEPTAPDAAGSRDSSVDRLHLYADESGTPGTGEVYVVGVLSAAEPERHRIAVADLRRAHSYRCRLEYRSTDRLKVPFARALIRYFVEDDDLRLVARFGGGPAANPEWTAADAYADAITRVDGRGAGTVTLRVEPRPGRDGFDEAVRSAAEAPTRVSVADTRRDDLAQLTGFLTGSVYGDLTGTGASVKRELIRELRSALGVVSLASGVSVENTCRILGFAGYRTG